MASVEENHSSSGRVHSIYSFHSPSSASSSRIWKEKGRSMRTVRSNLHSGEAADVSCSSIAGKPDNASENLTDSFVDLRLDELASRTNQSLQPSFAEDDFLALSHSFSDNSVCSSDVVGKNSVEDRIITRLNTFY